MFNNDNDDNNNNNNNNNISLSCTTKEKNILKYRGKIRSELCKKKFAVER